MRIRTCNLSRLRLQCYIHCMPPTFQTWSLSTDHDTHHKIQNKKHNACMLPYNDLPALWFQSVTSVMVDRQTESLESSVACVVHCWSSSSRVPILRTTTVRLTATTNTCLLNGTLKACKISKSVYEKWLNLHCYKFPATSSLLNCRAQWLSGRASNYRLRGPGFESCAAVLKAWASLFTLHCCSSLSCINEYLAIDSGG